MTKEQKQLKTKLSIVFWMNIAILLSVGIALLYTVGVEGRSATQQDFVMERFGIIAAIVIIPLSLKMFHNQYKKIVELELDPFLKRLYLLFNLRTLALSFVIILNFIGFYFIGALNFIYMAAISMLTFAMCYPTESVIDPIEKDIETEDKL